MPEDLEAATEPYVDSSGGSLCAYVDSSGGSWMKRPAGESGLGRLMLSITEKVKYTLYHGTWAIRNVPIQCPSRLEHVRRVNRWAVQPVRSPFRVSGLFFTRRPPTNGFFFKKSEETQQNFYFCRIQELCQPSLE